MIKKILLFIFMPTVLFAKNYNLTIGGFFYANKGIYDYYNVNSNIEAEYNNKITKATFTADGEYEKELSGNVYKSERNASLNYDFKLSTKIEYFMLTNYNYNKAINLKYRYNIGNGIKLSPLHSETLKFNVSYAPILEIERTSKQEKGIKHSFRTKAMKDFSGIKIGNINWFILEDKNNYRIDNIIYAEYMLTKVVSFEIEWKRKYNTKTITDKEIDLSVKIKI